MELSVYHPSNLSTKKVTQSRYFKINVLMNTDRTYIKNLVDNPSESLSVEIKSWINPCTPKGKSKIVRTILALRNHGGGYLIIGFDDKKLLPDSNNKPDDVKTTFHIDTIQSIVSKFSSEPFEVKVEFTERDNQHFPVIVVPSDVKTPVAAKSDLICKSTDKKLINVNDVYVRSLRANNTPSTTKVIWNDWPDIMEKCFDNREADIGRFLRRHLGSINLEKIREILLVDSEGTQSEIKSKEYLKHFLDESSDRFRTVKKERNVGLPEHGSWEVALKIEGEVPEHHATRNFLNLLNSTNPRITGWPIWLDSRQFSRRFNTDPAPYVSERVWEAYIVDLEKMWGFNNIEFMRLNPKGCFYLRRALQEDINFSRMQNPKQPFSVLDYGVPIVRCAEAFAVGIAFSKGMGCESTETNLAFAFRWQNLKGRRLTSLTPSKRDLFLFVNGEAYQDAVTTFVRVPLDTSLSALGDYVNHAVRDLYQVFDGFFLSKDEIEYQVKRFLERKG